MEHRELGVAPDDRRAGPTAAPARRRDRLERDPGLDHFGAALHLDRAERFVADHVAGRGFGERTDDDLAGCRAALEPTRGVDHVAHRGHVTATSQGADEHLARVHAHPHLDVGAQALAQARERALHLERAANGALGIVLVGHWRPEDRDDLVADDLVDPTSVRHDVAGHRLEAGVDETLHVLGVGRFGQGGEADEVPEEEGGDPPFVGAGDERVPTGRAEVGFGRCFRTAGGTRHGPQPTAAPECQVLLPAQSLGPDPGPSRLPGRVGPAARFGSEPGAVDNGPVPDLVVSALADPVTGGV